MTIFSNNWLFSVALCWLLHPLVVLSLNKDAEFAATVDHSTISIGDIVSLHLEVSHDPEQRVEFQSPGSRLGDWAIRSFQPSGPKGQENGKVADFLEVKLSIYRTGEFVIPPIQAQVINSNGTTETLVSKPVKIRVQSVLSSEAEDLKVLKKQADLPADYRPFLLFLAALCSTAILIYRLFRKLKKRTQSTTLNPVPNRPPEDQARDAIRQLLTKKLVESGYVKQFYAELSDIIKEYLGAKLGTPSMERTTLEFTRDLRDTTIAAQTFQSIGCFLTDCDQVKFAKYQPSEIEIAQIINQANEIIDATLSQADQIVSVQEVSA